jgi:hypothetical protein
MINRSLSLGGVSSRAVAQGRAGVRLNALALVVALLMPVILHMAPWGGGVPLGALLLPMFWAAFVAVFFYGLGAGALVAVFGPALNTLLTHFPEFRFNAGMSFELLVFVVFAWVVLRGEWGRRFWLLAPLAYVVAKVCSSGVRVAGEEAVGTVAESFLRAVSNGVPGLVVLAVINFALVRGWFGNRGSGGGGGGGSGGGGGHAAA